MKFVDRKSEIQRLNSALTSDSPSLIVIYGRRRIGKSTLIRKLLTFGRDIYFQADETQESSQLQLLAKAVGTAVQGFEKATYSDWAALLEALNYRVTERITLCLDEFPYLVKSNPALPSIIQRFWDTMSPKFNLILCGSSQQSMYSDILNAKSPLYGRADCIMKMQPISPAFIKEAMSLKTAEEAITQYSFWGGIPRYWQLCMEVGTFEYAVRSMLLSPDGTLTDEPNRLLRDELRDLALSRSLLYAIGSGACRMSEIAGRVGKNAAELTAPLKRLIDMGYLSRELPFGEDAKNGKRSLYHICDSFMNMYFHFIASNASLISIGREEAVWENISMKLSQYVGSFWERLCRRAVSGQILDGIRYGLAGRWWGTAYDNDSKKGTKIEVDVVSLSEDRRHLLVGECKWTSADYAGRILDELKRKARLLPMAKDAQEVHYALFLKEPPKDNPEGVSIFLPEDVLLLA